MMDSGSEIFTDFCVLNVHAQLTETYAVTFVGNEFGVLDVINVVRIVNVRVHNAQSVVIIVRHL